MSPPSPTRRLFPSLVFVLTCLVGIAGFTWWSADRAVESFERADHSHNVLFALESTLVHALNIQSGSRGYVLTKDQRYLGPYESSLVQMPAALALVRRLTAGNSRQQARVDFLERAVNEEITVMHERITARANQDLTAAAAAVADGRGKKTVDAIRQTIAIMEDEERRLLAEYSAAAHSATRLVQVVVLVLCGLAVPAVIATHRLLRRDYRRLRATEETLGRRVPPPGA